MPFMFDVNDGTMEFATDGIYLVTGFVGGWKVGLFTTLCERAIARSFI